MTKYTKAKPYSYRHVNRFWFWTTCYICFDGDPIREYSGVGDHDVIEIVALLNCAYELGLNTGIMRTKAGNY